MNYKLCVGCCDIFLDFNNDKHCILCKSEIESGEKNGWLQLNYKGGENEKRN